MTAKGSLRIDEISAAPCLSAVVSESSRSSDSGVWYSLMSSRTRRSAEPKRNSASAFAISVFPVPVGPTKRNTPSGRVGSVTPALIIAIRSTTAVDRLRLLEDAPFEERPDLVERKRRIGIEEGEREAGPGGEGREHLGAREALGSLLGRLGGGRLKEPQDVAGRSDPRQELLRELESLGKRRIVGLDAECVLLERVPHDGDRVGRVEGPNPDDLERASDPRPLGDEELAGCRSDLGEECDRPGLDVGKESIEQSLRAP